MVIAAAYLRGAISHAIKRARDLIEIAHSAGGLELRALQGKCVGELNNAVTLLAQALESLEASPRDIGAISRTYQAIAKHISDVERLGVFALSNTSSDDADLNRLLTAICMEIRYPLVTPSVSHTSQDYFEISSSFNLLRVPLLEGRYFLQLPDLYHELCHPLVALEGVTNPRLDPLSDAFRKIRNERGVALDGASVRAERRRGGADMTFRYALWRRCWIETWCEEFLCDAFGAFCAGPAYGWTNYHLCFRRGKGIFQVPRTSLTSHPADDARMSVILAVLRQTGCEQDAEAVERAWQDLASDRISGKTVLFDLCYPPEVLQGIASAAVTAFRECGIMGFNIQDPPKISGVLQDAWHMFWSPTTPYDDWEKNARARLLQEIR
ncbi:hypothetical protein [Mesorhizobium atlanticum]|uniref:Uncharacterized protein n=1 Tax=Mesorhizobium atlanticum TaxID=2233532 RepID=A0A330GM91_9HYPH|nr:hypothetical protein [Mesorhizobium atlanticum]RAZ72990.1 hypothetical protein DPM35_26760 [Mesorhizobium atlanticum]